MKNLKFIFVAFAFTAIFTQPFKVNANSVSIVTYTTNSAITFVENGITFSVFKNGEFDFYINSISNGLNVNYQSPNTNISFNSGYNYDPYVQYDTYGAVVQVENTPVYYDQYGRISQIGAININYRSNVVYRVGGLFMHYNTHGYYTHHTGYINHYNRHYVYHPHHNWFVRPYIGFTIVRPSPYRYNYNPHRYHYNNGHHHAYKHKYNHHNRHNKKRQLHHKHYSKSNNRSSHDFRRNTVAAHRKGTPHKKQGASYKKNHFNKQKRNIATSNSTKRNAVYNSRNKVKSIQNRSNHASKASVATKRYSKTVRPNTKTKPSSNRGNSFKSSSSRKAYTKVNSTRHKSPSRLHKVSDRKQLVTKKKPTTRKLKGRS